MVLTGGVLDVTCALLYALAMHIPPGGPICCRKRQLAGVSGAERAGNLGLTGAAPEVEREPEYQVEIAFAWPGRILARCAI